MKDKKTNLQQQATKKIKEHNKQADKKLQITERYIERKTEREKERDGTTKKKDRKNLKL